MSDTARLTTTTDASDVCDHLDLLGEEGVDVYLRHQLHLSSSASFHKWRSLVTASYADES